MFRIKYLWALVYSVLLLSFTAYVLLDTFVIPRVYTEAPSGQGQSEDHRNASPSEAYDTQNPSGGQITEAQSAPVITEDSYHDGSISITITEYREKDTNIYVADIQVSSAKYLKTALAQGMYGKNVTEKTSEIAGANSAVLAINGDYYGSQEKGYVVRNGVLYRNTVKRNQEDLVIYEDGSFSIAAEGETAAEELLERGAAQVLSFGPALVIDGAVSVSEDEEVGKAKTSNPRTAIGIVDSLHYLFVVSDGRTSESAGLSLYELAGFMDDIGAQTAYNLDGGGSSTMYFNGEVINNPTTNGRSIKERSISDIVYIGY